MANSIELYSGIRFPISKCSSMYDAEHFEIIKDFSIPLSRMPRFNGHTSSPYYVSDHVCRAVWLCSTVNELFHYIVQKYFLSKGDFNEIFYESCFESNDEDCIKWLTINIYNWYSSFIRNLLHHDDTEAIVGDLPSPVKSLCSDFSEIEGAIWEAMCKHRNYEKHVRFFFPDGEEGFKVCCDSKPVKEIDLMMLKVEKEIYHKSESRPTLNNKAWDECIECHPLWLCFEKQIKEGCKRYKSWFSDLSLSGVHEAFWSLLDQMIVPVEYWEEHKEMSFETVVKRHIDKKYNLDKEITFGQIPKSIMFQSKVEALHYLTRIKGEINA